jgi:hypothetical protein
MLEQYLNSAMWFVYGALIVVGIGNFFRSLKTHHHHDPAMAAAANRATESERRRSPPLNL